MPDYSHVTIPEANAEGRAAALAGLAFSTIPYSLAQGSSTRVLAIAWRRGFQEAEAEQGETLGHFRDVK